MPLLSTLSSRQLTGLSTAVEIDLDPVYQALSLDEVSYSEGDTVTATLNTANVADGTTVGYTITGISANDLSSGSLTGTFTINSNLATLVLTLNEDGLTEGTDTLVIALAATDSAGNSTGSLSDSATVLDTSNDPDASPWLDDNDNPVTVRSIIGGFSMQMNGVFATNPVTPFLIEGRNSGAQTTVTNITANTGTFIEVDDTGNSTSFTVNEPLNLVTVTYAVSVTTNNVNEGGSIVFTVTTTNVPNGFDLYWTVSNAGDFNTSSGTFEINSNTGTFSVTPTADAVTEGSESFVASVRTNSITGDVVATSGTIFINDTSQTPDIPPEPTYSTTRTPSSINEGDAVTINVTTTNVDDNTTLYWTVLNGTTTNDDFTAVDGSFIVNSNAGSFTVTAVADNTTDFALNEQFQVQIRTGSTSGTVVVTTLDVVLNDTSQTQFVSITPTSTTVREGEILTVTMNADNYPPNTSVTWRVVNGTTDAADFDGGTGYDVISQTGAFNSALGGDVNITLSIRNNIDASETFQIETLNTQGGRSGISEVITIIPAADYTLNVTNNGSGAYTFTSGSDADGPVTGDNPNLTFAAGDIVDFVVNASGHPFWIKTAPTIGTGNGADGVDNNGTDVGIVRWTVPDTSIYYYQCQFHAAMVGTIGQFNFAVSTNQTNANLRTLAVNAGWDGLSKVVATVNSNVYVYSTSTSTPGLTIDGSWPGGVELVNNGFIIGQGGNGGSGPNAAGAAGGPAISLGTNVTISNNSYIAGGGGGGRTSAPSVSNSSGGGGGGAGGGNGGGVAGGAGGGPGLTGGNGGGGGGTPGGNGGGAGGSGGPIDIYQNISGGGGGRILPGVGGAQATPNGSGAGGSANNPGATGSQGNGFSGGGGGWGAAGGNSGGAGGRAINLNGFTVTYSPIGTVWGVVS